MTRKDFRQVPIWFDSETSITLHELLSFAGIGATSGGLKIINELGYPLTEKGLSELQVGSLDRKTALSRAQFFLAALDSIGFDPSYRFDNTLRASARVILDDHWGSIYKLYAANPEQDFMPLLRGLQPIVENWSKTSGTPIEAHHFKGHEIE